jgi:hypothetical protein
VYARIASFEGGSTRRLNDEHVANGTIERPEGISRPMLLSNETGDRHLFITLFDARDALLLEG